MLNVIELFSGIGSQAKALSRIGIEYNVLATCDWDINAIIAYDIIHNGTPNIEDYDNLTDEELDDFIIGYSLSADGKSPLSDSAKRALPKLVKIYLLAAIERSNNLVDITNVGFFDLPTSFNVLTYSFPCQDLSHAGFWQGNTGGIDRNANNRSSLLWQVERILKEKFAAGEHPRMPRFLLMENVSAIRSSRNNKNFEEWKQILKRMNYENKVMDLNALNFGVPQNRKRTFMISVYCGANERIRRYVNRIFDEFDEFDFHSRYEQNRFTMKNVIKNDYENEEYFNEALNSNPRATVSRIRIRDNTPFIDEETDFVPTVTTKQDRYPNSGLIEFEPVEEDRADFRYLTPRECFLLMGFDEEDYESLIDNNFVVRRNANFFTRDKLNRMAGNSICVNVLESVFRLIDEMNNVIANL